MSEGDSDDVTDGMRRDLADLNDWERKYGRGRGGNDRLKSTGEAPARIADLKLRLARAGATIRWTGDGYVIDRVAPGTAPTADPPDRTDWMGNRPR